MIPAFPAREPTADRPASEPYCRCSQAGIFRRENLAAWAGWAATGSAPLILLALAWLVFGRTPRRETERFTQAVLDMKRESQALESILTIVATRISENRVGVTEEASRLMSLGDEASDRLGL